MIMTTARPMLFQAPMIRAIDQDRKSQTRRLAKFIVRDLTVNMAFSGLRAEPLRPGVWAIVSRGRAACWASRFTLEITEVRVQRLQDISEEDAIAEGAPKLVMDDDARFYEAADGTHRCGFAGLWEHINGKRPGASWADNPWVVALTFKTHRANVDTVLEQRRAA